MSFDNVTLSEVKHFNFVPPIYYRLVYNHGEEVRLRIVSNNFVVHEKKTINEKAQYPFLVKIQLNDTTEFDFLKSSLEKVVGEPVDVLCGNILYANATKDVYGDLKQVPAGVTLAFDVRLRHVVFFAASPRVKFVLESFCSVPLIAEKPTRKAPKKPKNAPQTVNAGESGPIDDFLASLRMEAN